MSIIRTDFPFFPTPIIRNSFIDNVFRDPVSPASGSVVICDLAFGFEHSGIYIGDNKIVHRDGNGYIDEVTPDEFLNRLDGKNNAISIYVSCHDTQPLTLNEAAERAINAQHNMEFDGYDILNKNCHHFTRYCLTGDIDQYGFDCSFSSLEFLLQMKYNMNTWRVWKYYE